jgi:hypothetical protein
MTNFKNYKVKTTTSRHLGKKLFPKIYLIILCGSNCFEVTRFKKSIFRDFAKLGSEKDLWKSCLQILRLKQLFKCLFIHRKFNIKVGFSSFLHLKIRLPVLKSRKKLCLLMLLTVIYFYSTLKR